MSPIISRIGFNRGFWRRLDSEPTYSISASTSSVNEGSSVTFTVTTTNVDSGTILYWTTNTISGTVNASDFSDSATTGSFTITNGTGSIIRTLSNDVATEGSESFQLQIRTGSISGVIVASSTTVTINDTSTPFAATGGTKTTIGSFIYHDLSNSNTFSVTSGSTTNAYLVLIGGGGGGASGSPGSGGQAGAGAGGVIIAPITLSSTDAPITVVVGGGGAQGTGQGGPGGSSGGNSTFGPNWVALGGGGAAAYPAEGGSPGGLYGGTAGSFTQATNPTVPANSRTFGFGNFGGTTAGYYNYGGGGGGGAGGAGAPAPTNGVPAATGGAGLPTAPYPWLTGTPFFAPTSQFFAGGGGGVGRYNTSSSGGSGGGGPATHSGTGTSGVNGTGSGGGGGSTAGGTGGSGRCIVVYPSNPFGV